jgi:hypothetical protein
MATSAEACVQSDFPLRSILAGLLAKTCKCIALHERLFAVISVNDTFRTCYRHLATSAYGGKADIRIVVRDFRY